MCLFSHFLSSFFLPNSYSRNAFKQIKMNTSLVDTIDLTYENFVLEGADGVGHLVHTGPVDQLHALAPMDDPVDVNGAPGHRPGGQLVVLGHSGRG